MGPLYTSRSLGATPLRLECSTTTKPGRIVVAEPSGRVSDVGSDAVKENQLACPSGTPHADQTPTVRGYRLGVPRARAGWLWRITFEPASRAGAIRRQGSIRDYELWRAICCRLGPAGRAVAGRHGQSG